MRVPHATANCLSEIPQFCFGSTLRAMRPALCARGTCAALFHSCTLALVLPLRACTGLLRRPDCARTAARAMRTPTAPMPIAPMSICANLCLDQNSRFGANAGYVVLSVYARVCAHTRAHVGVSAHTHTYTHTQTHTHTHSNKPILNTAR
jgi:hypothetical protein